MSKKNQECSVSFDGLVDVVLYEGSVQYLIKEEDGLVIVRKTKRDGVTLIPPSKEQIKWVLPRGEEVLKYYEQDDDKKLYEDLSHYHQQISELPSLEHYDLLVAWDFHTYLLEKFQYSPYIYLFAIPERGKTRTGKGLIYVAYRGVHLESTREAHLIRLAHDCKATIFVDVTDIGQKLQRGNSEDIILGRFERGYTVPRILYPDRGAFRDTVFYEIYGATVLGTNTPMNDIFESRALEINMPDSKSPFDNLVTIADAQILRERLVAFRARHMDKELPESPKYVTGRLGDITRPLFQMIKIAFPEREDHLLKLIRSMQETKVIKRTESVEAELLKVMKDIEGQVERGLLSIDDIAHALNDNREPRYHVGNQTVGKRLASLGFKSARTSTGHSAIRYEKDFLEHIMGKFGLLSSSDSSDSSESSDATGLFEETEGSES